MKEFFFVVMVCFLSSFNTGYSQHTDHHNSYVEQAMRAYGANPVLVSGIYYQPTHQIANGHPWLFTDKWIKGTVYIYHQSFPNQHLKYDILDDLMVLQASVNEDTKNEIILNRSLVDSISINERTFVNKKHLPAGALSCSFPEVLRNNSGVIVAEYSKKYIATYYNKPPFGKYTSTTRILYFLKKGIYQDISSKRKLLNSFKNHKKGLNKAIRDTKKRYSELTPKEIITIIHHCTHTTE